jgi:hypothetical protein
VDDGNFRHPHVVGLRHAWLFFNSDGMFYIFYGILHKILSEFRHETTTFAYKKHKIKEESTQKSLSEVKNVIFLSEKNV